MAPSHSAGQASAWRMPEESYSTLQAGPCAWVHVMRDLLPCFCNPIAQEAFYIFYMYVCICVPGSLAFLLTNYPQFS